MKALGHSAEPEPRARAKSQSAREEKEAMHNRPTRPAPIGERLRQAGIHDATHQHTGRLGTRAIVAPVAWEMTCVSDPRTPHLDPALCSSDWRPS